MVMSVMGLGVGNVSAGQGSQPVVLSYCCQFIWVPDLTWGKPRPLQRATLPWAWSSVPQKPDDAGQSGCQQADSPDSHHIRPECHNCSTRQYLIHILSFFPCETGKCISRSSAL